MTAHLTQAPPRPSFPFTVEGPDGWSVLRADPAHAPADLDAMIGAAVGAVSPDLFDPEDETALRDLLRAVVENARAAGVVLMLATHGVDDLHPYLQTVTLSFADTAPAPASVEMVDEALTGQDGVSSTFTAPGGDGRVLVSVDPAPEGIPSRFVRGDRLVTAQAYRPIAATTWTACVTATSTLTSHSELMRQVAVRMAASIRRGTPDPARTTATGPQHDHDTGAETA